MTITPFLALPLRGKKDAIRARQRARRVASLLHFDVHEQACVAAAAFVISCQALALLAKPRLCFQIESRQLQIAACDEEPCRDVNFSEGRIGSLFADKSTLYRLTKPLPPQNDTMEEDDLGWLVQKVEQTSHETLFDEIVKQNQEILALLHDLRLYHVPDQEKAQKTSSPDAA
jgi:hypothetical protein